jgi:hypothetical protein
MNDANGGQKGTPPSQNGNPTDSPSGSAQAELTKQQEVQPVVVHVLSSLWLIGRRTARWLFLCVLLSFIPIALSWAWLEKGSPLCKALEHGELAILAAALAATALDAALGNGPPQWLKTLLVVLCVGVLMVATALLAAFVGHASQLATNELIELSEWLLGLAIILGVVAVSGDVGRSSR